MCHARTIGIKTNNQAEYQALIDALQDHRGLSLRVHSDSRLLVKQMTGEWEIRDTNLKVYALAVPSFECTIEYVWVPREENKEADCLVNLVLDQNTDRTQDGNDSLGT